MSHALAAPRRIAPPSTRVAIARGEWGDALVDVATGAWLLALLAGLGSLPFLLL